MTAFLTAGVMPTHRNLNSMVFRINVFILCLALLGNFSIIAAYLGGLLILSYISFNALSTPIRGVYLIIGTKLTFDILWFIRVDDLFPLSLLDLFAIPIILVIFGRSAQHKHETKWPLVYAIMFIVMTVLARYINDLNVNLEALFRQAGIFIGLVIGLRYIKRVEQLDQLAQLLLISTIIPVCAILVQYGCSLFGIEVLNSKVSGVRGYRSAGFNYDPATTGMVSIVCLLSNMYLIVTDRVSRKFRKYHFALLGIAMFAIFIGTTRSIWIVAVLIVLFTFVRHFKLGLSLALMISILFILLDRTYFENTLLKSQRDLMVSEVHVESLLTDREYRPLMTGRVGLWQDVWYEFAKGTQLQRLFGTGLSSNAHSSYFFLLLQVGVAGLIFYFLFHMKLLWALWRSKISSQRKNISILCLLSLLFIGMSLTAVVYTSFQWIVYMIVGAIISIDSENSGTLRRQTFAKVFGSHGRAITTP